jgi:hypothetical protein
VSPYDDDDEEVAATGDHVHNTAATCDMDLINNIECHLPDSPSSQLSALPVSAASTDDDENCDNKEGPPSSASQLDMLNFGDFLLTAPSNPPLNNCERRIEARDDKPFAAPVIKINEEAPERLASKQQVLSRKHAALLAKIRRLAVNCICSEATNLVKKVRFSVNDDQADEKPAPSSQFTAPLPVFIEKCEESKVTAAQVEECEKWATAALLSQLESKYEPPQAAKRYLNRLQSVTFIKEKSAAKRKPSVETAVWFNSDGANNKKSKLLESTAKQEVRTVFGQFHSQWRCLAYNNDVADLDNELDIEVAHEHAHEHEEEDELTDSSSGGESCDEIEGFNKQKFRTPGVNERKPPPM